MPAHPGDKLLVLCPILLEFWPPHLRFIALDHIVNVETPGVILEEFLLRAKGGDHLYLSSERSDRLPKPHFFPTRAAGANYYKDGDWGAPAAGTITILGAETSIISHIEGQVGLPLLSGIYSPFMSVSALIAADEY